MEKLENIVFYSMDRAIRSYRQYAQQQLKKNDFAITIDQWLVIKCLIENPDVTQVELSERVFKDNASVTRILGYYSSKPNLSNAAQTKPTAAVLNSPSPNSGTKPSKRLINSLSKTARMLWRELIRRKSKLPEKS